MCEKERWSVSVCVCERRIKRYNKSELQRERETREREHTGDEEIKIVFISNIGDRFTVAFEVSLALLANLDKDMFDSHGFGLQLDDLERVRLEGPEVLGSEGD